MTKLESIKTQYIKAVAHLEEVLKMPKNEIIRDSAIKRFELLFDLSWKLIKTFLEQEKGVKCVSPKDCFKEAYKQEILEYDEFWLIMTDWRNQAVHTYNEEFANIFYDKLPQTLKYFCFLREKINKYIKKKK